MATHDSTVSSLHPSEAEKEVKRMEQDCAAAPQHKETEEVVKGAEKNGEAPTSQVVEDEKPKAAAEEDEKPKAEDEAGTEEIKKVNEEENPKGDELPIIEEEKPKAEELPVIEEVKAANEEEKPKGEELPVIEQVKKADDQVEDLPVVEEVKKPDEEEKPKGEELPITEEGKTADDEEEKPKVEEEEKPRCDELPVIEQVKKAEEEEKPKVEEVNKPNEELPVIEEEEKPRCDELGVIAEAKKAEEEEQQIIEVPSVEAEEKIEDKQIEIQTAPVIAAIDHEPKPVAPEDVEKPIDESIKDADEEKPVEQPKTIEETKGQEEEEEEEKAEEVPAEAEQKKEEIPPEPAVVVKVAQCLEQETQSYTKHAETLQVADEKEQEAKVTGESSEEGVAKIEANQHKIDQCDKAAQVKTVSRDEEAVATKTEGEANEAAQVEKKVDEVPATATQAAAQKPHTEVKQEVAPEAGKPAKQDESKDGNHKKEDVVFVKPKQSNIISKVKQTLVKAKKAIIGKSPTPKSETKTQVKPK